MIEINCTECQNLINTVDGCKLYGPDPVEGVKACAADMFINYSQKAANPPKFTPGLPVWVLERDEYITACDIAGYIFLAEVAGAVILTPYINEMDQLEELLVYHIEETRTNYDTDLVVYPLTDCYSTWKEAEAALAHERGKEAKT